MARAAGKVYFCSMYTREQQSQLRQAFWTSFGQYMQPVPAASGEKINWINYKTGIRHLHFKTDADRDRAIISIQLTHADEEKRQLYYQALLPFRQTLEAILGEEWEWLPYAENEEGRPISMVFAELQGVNVLNKNDWPRIISFFKPRLVALDQFWYEAKEVFDMLG